MHSITQFIFVKLNCNAFHASIYFGKLELQIMAPMNSIRCENKIAIYFARHFVVIAVLGLFQARLAALEIQSQAGCHHASTPSSRLQACRHR